jgi:4,5-DOPA dioxygenase extradiol
MKMPVLFVGHGSPMNAIEDNAFTRTWSHVGKQLPKPKAILSISAHWYTELTRISDVQNPRLVYDMYGFPPKLYEVKYPVKGAPELANQLKDLLGDQVVVDNQWGIDHGTWSVLVHLFPDADVPVVQLSIDQTLSPEQHFKLAETLKELRNEGIMILGSGNIVHNLHKVNWGMQGGYEWAYAFDVYIKSNIVSGKFENVIAYERAGSSHKEAFYTLEHFLPLLYVLGCVAETDALTVFNDVCTLGSISMTGYLFK